MGTSHSTESGRESRASTSARTWTYRSIGRGSAYRRRRSSQVLVPVVEGNNSQPQRRLYALRVVTPVVVSPSPFNTTSTMPSLKKKKDARFVVDRKIRFLGRFFTDQLNENTLTRLRAVVKEKRGAKSRVKLSPNGLTTGGKFSSMMSKAPAGSIPLGEIRDVVVDELLRTMLLVIAARSDGKTEILAYRVRDPMEGLEYQNAFANIVTGMDRDAVSTGFADVPDAANWTMKTTTINRHIRAENGNVSNGLGLDGVNYHRMARSTSDMNTRSAWSNPKFEAHRRHQASLNDVVDYNHNIRRDYDESASMISAASVDSMKKQIDDLSREVHELRSLLGERNEGDNISVLTGHTGSVGEARVRVGQDYRTTSRPRSLSQGYYSGASTSRNTESSATSGHGIVFKEPGLNGETTKIVYKREGEDEEMLRPRQTTMSNTRNRSVDHTMSLSRNNSHIHRPADFDTSHQTGAAYATISKQQSRANRSQDVQRSSTLHRSKSVDDNVRSPRHEPTTPTFNYPPPARSSNYATRSRFQSTERHPTQVSRSKYSQPDHATHYMVR